MDTKLFRKELMTLAIPLALQNLLNALVGAFDALMLGRVTQEAIAAVSLANQVSFVMSLFNGAIIGSVSVLEPLAKSYLVKMLIFSAFYLFAFSFNTIYTCGVFPAGAILCMMR